VTELFDPVEPIRLRKLDIRSARRQVLTSMLRVSAEYLGVALPSIPAPGQSDHFDRRLEDPIWTDPLYLMMAALVSIRAGVGEALSLSRTDLAFRLAERDINRLRNVAPTQGGKAPRELLVHLAAYATLASGLSAAQALQAAEQECQALGVQYPNGYGALKEDLHAALPALDQGCSGGARHHRRGTGLEYPTATVTI
jgi:hypothetical protein